MKAFHMNRVRSVVLSLTGMPVDPEVWDTPTLPWFVGTLRLRNLFPAFWMSLRVSSGIFFHSSGPIGPAASTLAVSKRWL